MRAGKEKDVPDIITITGTVLSSINTVYYLRPHCIPDGSSLAITYHPEARVPTHPQSDTYSQLYSSESPILTVKHVASFRQYHSAYAAGHLYVWNVIFGLGVGVGGLGFGVVLLEQASAKGRQNGKRRLHLCSQGYVKLAI